MTRPALTLRDLRALLSISAAKAGPNEDAVAVRATWAQTFNSGDADKIAELYTKDAMMFGSTAHLFTGDCLAGRDTHGLFGEVRTFKTGVPLATLKMHRRRIYAEQWRVVPGVAARHKDRREGPSLRGQSQAT